MAGSSSASTSGERKGRASSTGSVSSTGRSRPPPASSGRVSAAPRGNKRKRAGSAALEDFDDIVLPVGGRLSGARQEASVNRRALRNYEPIMHTHPRRPSRHFIYPDPPEPDPKWPAYPGHYELAWHPTALYGFRPEFSSCSHPRWACVHREEDPPREVGDNLEELETGWEGSYFDPSTRVPRERRRQLQRDRDYQRRARRLGLGRFVRDRARYLAQRSAAPLPRLTPAESFHANRVRAAAGVTPFPLPEGAWARRRHYLDARDRHRETVGPQPPLPTRPATRRRKAAKPVKRARG